VRPHPSGWSGVSFFSRGVLGVECEGHCDLWVALFTVVVVVVHVCSIVVSLSFSEIVQGVPF